MSIHKVRGGYSVRWHNPPGMLPKHPSRTFRKKKAAEDFDDFIHDKKALGAAFALTAEQSFQDIAEEFWTSYNKTVSEGTRVRNRRYLTSLIDHFSGYRLCDVSAPTLETYRLHLEKQGKGAPTIRHIFFLLSKLFRHCIRMGYIQSNPVQAIDKPSAPRSRLIQPFPPERVEAVRGWFLERGHEDDALLVSLMAYAGCGPAEAYEYMEWESVGDTTLLVRGEKTDKRDRSIPLLEPLRADLTGFRELSEVGPFVSRREHSSGTGITGLAEPTNVVRLTRGRIFPHWTKAKFDAWRDGGRWRKMVDALDFRCPTNPKRRAVPYDLRHAYATLMLGQGTRLPELADFMGNSLAVCTNYYAHLDHVGERMDAGARIWAARNLPDVRVYEPQDLQEYLAGTFAEGSSE